MLYSDDIGYLKKGDNEMDQEMRQLILFELFYFEYEFLMSEEYLIVKIKKFCSFV